MTHVLGIDLGCTKYLAAVEDADTGEVVRTGGDTRPEAGFDATVRRICDAIDLMCAGAGIGVASIAAIGIGAPGPLDRSTGVITDSPQLPWGRAPLAAALMDRTSIMRLAIDNDCKVGGIAELRRGAAVGASGMAYLGIGTGIGGCVVVDGEVVYGASGNASEVGHMVVWMDGPACGCGSRGCLEGIASGSGIARRARARAAGADGGELTRRAGRAELVTAAHVADAAQDGDPAAMELWSEAQRAIGAACASLMNALSPEVIVLGGGIPARHGTPYIDAIAEHAQAMAFGPNASATRIVPASLGADSVLIGALELARDAMAGRGMLVGR